jgi:hypothetical protein
MSRGSGHAQGFPFRIEEDEQKMDGFGWGGSGGLADHDGSGWIRWLGFSLSPKGFLYMFL